VKSALVAGCGYVGKIVAQLFCNAGWQVAGVTRSEESARALADEPWRTVACDCSDRDAVEKSLPEFRDADFVVHCASAGGGGEEAYRRAYFDVAKNLLEILAPKKFLFTSSTSVYAQNDGSVVTEESEAAPLSETAKVLRETENLVLVHGGIVARLAGIYGPDRWMTLRKFLDGTTTLDGDGGRFMNWIHRDDAASAIFHLATHDAPSGIHNVADDSPTTQRECYEWLAAHFHKALPPYGPASTDRKRGVTNKRVSNAKLRALGWRCIFPSPKHALAHDARLSGT
jgi:nucleoside-diphosphate-sugar epimerase